MRQAAVWLPGNSAGVEVMTSKAPAEARTNDRPPFNLRKGKLGGNKREGGGWVVESRRGDLGTDFTSENIGKSQVMNVPAEELRTHQ